MSKIPIITVTSITLNSDGTGFANAEQVPDDLPTWENVWQEPDPEIWPEGLWMRCCKCGNGPLSDSEESCDRHDPTPCSFDAVLSVGEVPPRPSAQVMPRNTAMLTRTITDMHHADECRKVGQFANDPWSTPEPAEWFCHPNALPGKVHLYFEENTDG